MRDEINKSCQGYREFGPNLPSLIGRTKSINELVHLLHSYIVNNETILQSMPVVAQRERNHRGNYVLHGEENDISRAILDGLPDDETIGRTDIVSMENRILMMVKGKAHALTVDLDTIDDEDIIVHYFLPKIGNRAMVKKLPGAKNLQEDCAKGTFDTTRERVVVDILDFIEKVPSDRTPVKAKPAFGMEELQQMATVPASQNGRRMGRMEALQSAIKGAKAKLQEVLEGGTKDEPDDHDL